MIRLPQPSPQRNCRVVSLTIPRDVQAEARSLVDGVGISLSVYVTELLRADLAARKKRALEGEGKAA